MLQEEDLSYVVRGCIYEVFKELGPGFLEKVYENALAFEVRETGLRVKQQAPIQVRYRGQVMGDYLADLIVNDTVLVELKSAQAIADAHKAQCLNYLRATGRSVGLLLNSGAPRLHVRRIVWRHDDRDLV